ncbi:aldo/keto reductase [Mucisphaera calidilacus]|uniref:L-glyceraldehyde 3-phosphate reductase n=1 Tax=Mucisphaera calidilacus TaxID=2527982 RepID=A0A518BUC8_9BACT|nr:aldo/keto reductase [Mucisphaera calidilacus]QDU70592.1 L-glyceraldehyde 3-phosphate reductase [Mucisphaera calidilacus]
MTHTPAPERYTQADGWFRRCGNSGLMLPAISLGCWHNFGDPGTDAAKHDDESSMHHNCRQMLFTAFDLGITHFDLANNYGPPPGSAETRVGRILREDLAPYRDELIISSKAGYRMWPGPYGEFGSRKYLIASCDASLRRLGLDYVDIFYSHRPDPETPLEETMGALDHLVRSGKALYTGISSYDAEFTARALKVCRDNGLIAPIIHQPVYNMLNRWIEDDLVTTCGINGLGIIPFCPLAQGILTNKYLDRIPDDSRAASDEGALQSDSITAGIRTLLKGLDETARQRDQSVAQLALNWVLRDPRITSALIGASRPEQITDCVAATNAPPLTRDEIQAIDRLIAASKTD